MPYHAMIPAPSRRAGATVCRDDIHAAAQFLAKSIVERRNTIPILSNVLVTVDDTSITIRGSDLDMEAVWTVPAYDTVPGRFTVDAAMLADAVKAVDKGATIALNFDASKAHCRVASGRVAMCLPTLPADDFPALGWRDMEPAQVDAAALLSDLVRLRPFMSKEQSRYYLNGVAFGKTDGGELSMTATTGAQFARIVRGMPDGLETLYPVAGSIVPRKAVETFAKALKGATSAARLAFAPDRVRLDVGAVSIVSKLVDGTFPDTTAVMARLDGAQALAFVDLEPDLAPATVEAFRKALGVMPSVSVGDDAYGFTVEGAPEFLGLVSVDRRERVGSFDYGFGTTGALDYLAKLADTRGFDLNRIHALATAAGEDMPSPPQSSALMIRRGLVLGATFGHVTRAAAKRGDVIGRRPATPDELDAYCARDGEGFRGAIERDGLPLKADRDLPAEYVDGAFSIVMPREREEAVTSAVRFYTPDGMAYPLRTTTGSNGITGAIELSEAAVRRLAGPVDPSTFVDIPETRLYRGAPIAAGYCLPTPPRIAKADALRMSAAEMTAYAQACRPVPVEAAAPTVAPVSPLAAKAPGHYAAGMAAHGRGEARALPSYFTTARGNNPRAWFAGWDAADGQAALPAPAVVAPAAVDPVEAVEPAAPAMIDPPAIVATSPIVEPAPAVEPAQASDAPGGDVAALTARLAALEAIVARLARPATAGKRVRSEAERRAVLRAWRIRGEARVRADLDRRALEAATRELDGTRAALSAVRDAERINAHVATQALAAAAAADNRAARMVGAATRHRTARRRLADDLRGAQAEARALARRLADAPRVRATATLDVARVLNNLERAAGDLHHVGTRREERPVAAFEYLMGPGGMAALDNALALIRPASANYTRESGAVAALAA